MSDIDFEDLLGRALAKSLTCLHEQGETIARLEVERDAAVRELYALRSALHSFNAVIRGTNAWHGPSWTKVKELL